MRQGADNLDYDMKKTKLWFIAFLAFIASVALTGCAKREIKNIDSNGKNIICFGNSITFGYGANPGEDYPAALSKMITIPVINAGIDGDTTIEALKRIDSDVLEREPLLVIIEFGGNDFLRKIPMDETLRNIEEIIKKIYSKGAMVAVADVSAGMIMSSYRKEFKRLSKKYNTIFIPKLFSDILTNPTLKSDSIHPNAEGYKLIAQKIHRAITPYLDRNISLKR